MIQKTKLVISLMSSPGDQGCLPVSSQISGVCIRTGFEKVNALILRMEEFRQSSPVVPIIVDISASLREYSEEQWAENLALLEEVTAECYLLPAPSKASSLVSLIEILRKNREIWPWIFLKVGSRSVYEHMDEWFPVVDGIVIARSELAAQEEPAVVPMMVKELIDRCSENAKPALISSDVLKSMALAPSPTRAEVSDVANAVFDRADGLILPQDLSYGPYYGRAIETCTRTMKEVEGTADLSHNWQRRAFTIRSELDSVAQQALETARRVRARLIVCVTRFGITALKLASFRPPLPVLAVTFSPEVGRRLALVRGVETFVLEGEPHWDSVLPVVKETLLAQKRVNHNDLIIFVTVSISSLGREASNLFTIQQIQ